MAQVEVKVVLADGEAKRYEFASVDLAIVALGKMVKAPGQKAVVAPLAGTTPAPGAPAAPTPVEKPPRKPRADRGQPREPYGPRADSTRALTPEELKAIEDARVNKADDEARQKMQDARVAATEAKPATVAQPAGSSGATAASPVAVAGAAPEAAQKAMEALFNSKGVEVAKMVLSRFGAARVRDLLPEQHQDFAAKATAITALDKAAPDFAAKMQAVFAPPA